jgi:hypothetical protein
MACPIQTQLPRSPNAVCPAVAPDPMLTLWPMRVAVCTPSVPS